MVLHENNRSSYMVVKGVKGSHTLKKLRGREIVMDSRTGTRDLPSNAGLSRDWLMENEREKQSEGTRGRNRYVRQEEKRDQDKGIKRELLRESALRECYKRVI